MTESPVWRDLYGMTQDGVRLHLRDYGDAKSTLTPIVCLPGLTRHAADFDDLARALTSKTTRRVLVLESRGRGGSEWAAKPEDYSIPVEVGDLIHMLDIFAIKRAIFVGTSRGGLLTMVLAAMRPDLIGLVARFQRGDSSLVSQSRPIFPCPVSRGLGRLCPWNVARGCRWIIAIL